MKIGLQLPNYTWPDGADTIGARLADIAAVVDDGDFYSLWVMDHFFQLEFVGPVDSDMLESYSTLSFLAAMTHSVKLGTLVTGANYRHPGALVKTVTTLDVLSGGRAYFGVGAGWFEREALGLGLPFPPIAERFEWLEETLQIAHQMWSGKVGAFDGKHFHLKETLCVPHPLRSPHPPILIGGMGERKTMRLVAQYGDACNLFVQTGKEAVQQRLNALKGHCEALGRDYDQIEKTGLAQLDMREGQMTANDVLRQCEMYHEWGIQQVIFGIKNVHEITPLEELAAKVIPVVKSW